MPLEGAPGGGPSWGKLMLLQIVINIHEGERKGSRPNSRDPDFVENSLI